MIKYRVRWKSVGCRAEKNGQYHVISGIQEMGRGAENIQQQDGTLA